MPTAKTHHERPTPPHSVMTIYSSDFIKECQSSVVGTVELPLWFVFQQTDFKLRYQSAAKERSARFLCKRKTLLPVSIATILFMYLVTCTIITYKRHNYSTSTCSLFGICTPVYYKVFLYPLFQGSHQCSEAQWATGPKPSHTFLCNQAANSNRQPLGVKNETNAGASKTARDGHWRPAPNVVFGNRIQECGRFWLAGVLTQAARVDCNFCY